MSKLIAIEGLDGSGKQTQSALLKEALASAGYTVASIDFPRYGKKSAVLCEAYLHGEFGESAADVNAYAASTLFAVDRYASYMTEWKSSYDESDYLVADRYVTSNAIHQCSKLPREEWESFVSWLFDFEFKKLGLPRPDKVFYLSMPVERSEQLVVERYAGDETKKDIHERDEAYLRHSRDAAEWCCDYLDWKRVECCREGKLRPIDEIHQEILQRAELVDE
jgi:dTMP kinase